MKNHTCERERKKINWVNSFCMSLNVIAIPKGFMILIKGCQQFNNSNKIKYN